MFDAAHAPVSSLLVSEANPAVRLDTPAGEPSFSIARDVDGDGVTTSLRLAGRFAFEDSARLWASLERMTSALPPGPVRIHLDGVAAIDGGAMALLVHVKGKLEARGNAVEIVGGDSRAVNLLHLYRGDETLEPLRAPRAESVLEQIGRATLDGLQEVGAALGFLGSILLAAWRTVRAPATGNFEDVVPTMARSGADAVPIVLLINFLMGFVMAFQGAVGLKKFGANIYVADLVALSITRELGPLMTAIILCGRTGAAFAAELGSMRVSEETDALRTLGFDPLRFLVFPRVLGLLLVAPILTLMADTVGIAGGLVVGCVSLELTVTGYLNETIRSLRTWDVFSGILKSGAFALAIGAVACQQGLAASGGAAGVGRRTTSAVVFALFALIVLDALFTVIYHAYDL